MTNFPCSPCETGKTGCIQFSPSPTPFYCHSSKPLQSAHDHHMAVKVVAVNGIVWKCNLMLIRPVPPFPKMTVSPIASPQPTSRINLVLTKKSRSNLYPAAKNLVRSLTITRDIRPVKRTSDFRARRRTSSPDTSNIVLTLIRSPYSTQKASVNAT